MNIHKSQLTQLFTNRKCHLFVFGALMACYNAGAIHWESVPSENIRVGSEWSNNATTMAGGAAVFTKISADWADHHSWRLVLKGNVKGPIHAYGDLSIVVESDSVVDFTSPSYSLEGNPAISCSGQLKISGPGSLTIKTSGWTGIRGSGTLSGGLAGDVVFDGANIAITTTKAVGRDVLGNSGFGVYATRVICSSSTVSVRMASRTTGDGIYCKNFKADKSVVMAAGGKRGVFVESTTEVGHGPGLWHRYNKNYSSGSWNKGEICISKSALYAFGSTTGLAVGDYEHNDRYTHYGNFWATDSVVVAQGDSEFGVISGCCLHFNNVAGAIRGAKCAIRVYADAEIGGKNSSAPLVLVGGISETGNAATGSALLGAYDGGKTGTSGSAIKISGGKTTIYCPAGCGIFTPGTTAVSGGSITIKTGSDKSMATMLTQSGLAKQLKKLAGISTKANPGVLGVKPKSYRTNIRPANGVCTQAYKQTGGNIAVDCATSHGMALGWEKATSSDTTVKPSRRTPGAFTMKGGYLRLCLPASGKITAAAKLNKLPDVGLSSLDNLLSGSAKMKMTGGRLLAGGLKSGILWKGKCTITSGTLWALSGETTPKKDIKDAPYMIGVALYAKGGIEISGGSIAVNRLVQRPTNGKAAVYRASMGVKGGGPVKLTGLTPSYYGKKDLYPRSGKLWLWMPAAHAELYCKQGYQGKGTYNPRSGGSIAKHDGNEFVIWTKVGSASSSGGNLVKKPKTTITVPGIGTITVPDSNGGSSSSKTSSSKTSSSKSSSSKSSSSNVGVATSTAALNAALASAPPLPAGWVRVKFDANGGTTSTHYRDFQTVEYVTYSWSSTPFEITRFPMLEWIPFPKRKGYAFDGWRTTRNGGTGCTQWTIASDITYYANWTKKKTKHQIAFFGEGGKVSWKKVSSTYGIYRIVTYGEKFGTLPKASRKGYVLLGWYQRDERKGPKLTPSHIVPSAGSWLTSWHAVWAKKKYKVAFYANGGTGSMAAQTMTYGKAAKLKAAKFKRTSYVFVGWAKSAAQANQGKVVYKNKKAVKNLTTDGKTVKLYAVWKKK